MAITYGVTRCALGFLLVATSEQGVCAVSLGDSKRSLVEALHKDLGRENPVRAKSATREELVESPVVQPLLDNITGLINEPGIALNIKLDVKGTEFQKAVWLALGKIPAGETRSYSQLAESLDPPTSPRAVARACASNQLALVIPCHRVIAADGGLSGYRWGLARKAQLLEREGSGAPSAQSA